METEIGMTGPGKDRKSLDQGLCVLFIFCPHSSHATSHPELECELHEAREFCLFA